MARPVRCRRICFEPKYDSFSPCGAGQTEQVLLSVDECEAVRLIMKKELMSSVPDRWGCPVLQLRKCMKGREAELRIVL